MGSWGSRTIVRQSGFINKLRTMNMGLAMLRLGMIYENGWYDIEINLEEALKWYQLAADQDYDGAQECVDRVEAALQNAAEDS